jgi:hypothetical protein
MSPFVKVRCLDNSGLYKRALIVGRIYEAELFITMHGKMCCEITLSNKRKPIVPPFHRFEIVENSVNA